MTYIPSYQVSASFPEPRQDETPIRRTGRQLRAEDFGKCDGCGEHCDALPGLDGHTFCSHECVDRYVRR